MDQIPKIIHYCWFGHNKMPKSSINYIKSWQKKCPDYKIIKWSEDNFNVNKYKFTKEAYKGHNWAALSDYVRFIVLYKFGGIYLDTDVEVLKSLDPLITHKWFVGMEDYGVINTGLICGVIPKSTNIHEIIKIYNIISNKPNYKYYMNDQVHILTNYFHKRLGFKFNNKLQNLQNGIVVYPTCYFCPERYGSDVINCNKYTYTIHHYFGSWTNKDSLSKQHIHFVLRKTLRKIVGTKCYFYLYRHHMYSKKGSL